ncbi:hypothetical protein JTB14_020866 [Gonioctena quinquepunctata]|nr:hypothetical protein JTB14_020866 [Gonioctena quinquepunctata]
MICGLPSESNPMIRALESSKQKLTDRGSSLPVESREDLGSAKKSKQ